MSIFEKASRQKLRFKTPKGWVSVEDLWDMPLDSSDGCCLDKVAVELDRKLSSVVEKSFVRKEVVTNEEDELRFSIVRHIIDVRLDEKAKRMEAAERKAERDRLMDLIAQKQDEDDRNKSIEELRERLDKL